MSTTLSGWGSFPRAKVDYVRPETPGGVKSVLDARSTVARGLGRSYGDAALNEGGQVVGLTRCDRYLGFDEASGRLEVEAGVSLAQILRDFAPRGWFPYITPGTKYVTVGGCIANDVHGKAHHAQGSFSEGVESMRVLLASGEVVHLSRTEDPDLFWATFGGMGLLGVVLTAVIRLRPVETTYFTQEVVPAHNLDDMLDQLDAHDESHPYSVASLDVFARGRHLGRGVLNLGDHAPLDALPAELRGQARKTSGDPRIGVPFELPGITLNRLSVGVVNQVIQAVQRNGGPFAHYEKFVYPLDFVAHWNRGYGRRGFTQYQFVIPFDGARPRLRAIMKAIQDSGELPFLNVLKRMGQASQGHLSFPMPGYTFAIDFPIRRRTAELLARLDDMVIEGGGRIYLGKDAFVSAAAFRRMMPRLDEWLEIKARVDPHGRFTSNLGRRVGLSR